MKISKTYALAGGGAVGPLLLIYLAKFAAERRSDLSGHNFNLIDPKGFANGGIAFGECNENYHRLNSVPKEMSPWDVPEYPRYLESRGIGFCPNTFNKRADYRPFLQQKTAQAIEVLRDHGAHIAHIFEKIDIAGIDNERAHIIDERGHIVINAANLNDIKLCVGYGPNENFPHLQNFQGEGYFHSVYDTDINAIKSEDTTIALLGLNAAAYDFTNAYLGNPHSTNLVTFSKNRAGLGIRNVSIEKSEISTNPFAHNIPQFSNSIEMESWIYNAMQETKERNNVSQRRVALDFAAHIKDALKAQTSSVAREFIKSATLAAIKTAATPLPLISHQKMASFSAQHYAQNFDEHCVSRTKSGQFKLNIDNQDILVDTLVNATGHGRLNNPVIVSLLNQGLARIDEKLGTLETDATGYNLLDSNISCIGPTTHQGIDGIESFAKYVEPLALEMISIAPAQLSGLNLDCG